MKRFKKSISYTLMVVGGVCLGLLTGLIAMSILTPESPYRERIAGLFGSSLSQEERISEDIYTAFKMTLQSEVRRELGMPIEGYEPSMFLTVFPGLSETDFEGVEASIGFYTVEDGRLVHKLDDSRLIHSAAGAITDRGMDTLLINISARLKVDLNTTGTLTKIMDALVYEEGNLPVGGGNGAPGACTMDAKICPDGSTVGRVGPQCEFAPCP